MAESELVDDDDIVIGDFFVGTVRSWGWCEQWGYGYGFLTCERLQACTSSGKDPFIHHNEINGCQVGDEVSFTAVLNTKGHIHAINLKKMGRRNIIDAYRRVGYHPDVWIRSGHNLWIEFCTRIKLYEDINFYDGKCVIALLDHNDVINTLNIPESENLATDFYMCDGVIPLVCSKGVRYSHSNANPSLDHDEWFAISHQCRGYIFTDHNDKRPNGSSVTVCRDAWMERESRVDCIRVNGNKGQVAALLGLPCILFDDKEGNVDLLEQYTTEAVPLCGVVVRRGGKYYRRVRGEHYARSYDSSEWAWMSKRFRYQYAALVDGLDPQIVD